MIRGMQNHVHMREDFSNYVQQINESNYEFMQYHNIRSKTLDVCICYDERKYVIMN